MLWQEWIESVSMAFNTDVAGTGILVSLILIITVDLFTIISLKGSRALSISLVVVDFFLILSLVWAQWLPTFTGVVLALIMALLGAYIIRERM